MIPKLIVFLPKSDHPYFSVVITCIVITSVLY